MKAVLAILGCAVLFVVFGLMRRGRGEGCSSCSTSCPTKESHHGHA